MHGYTQDQMKTAPDIRGSELIHPDHLQRFNDLIRTAYEDGKSSVGFEMKVIRRDGKVRWLLTQCSFVKTADGTIVYGYVSDCTDLKNMEEKTKPSRMFAGSRSTTTTNGSCWSTSRRTGTSTFFRVGTA